MLGQVMNLLRTTIGVGSAVGTKNWQASQKYEVEFAIQFMDSEFFRNLYRGLLAGELRASRGHSNPLLMKEFFNDSLEEWTAFVDHIRGKTCLDIGPSVMSPLAGWDVAAERHVIEPLFPQINEWQVKNLGGSAFEGLICHGQEAEKPIPRLLGAVNGAILCRNMLDHTPGWPFVLQLMAAYAAEGCRLLLWADLDHRGTEDIGHYTITSDRSAFKRLVEQFGFQVIRECEDKERVAMNWGCFAVKT